MSRADEFEALRPLLFSIAYRILGSVGEAEDAVQETWLRYEAAPEPESPKAFLSTVVTRVSIDVLRSARRRREEYVGPWFPEPLLTDPYEDPERAAELADSVSMAALLLLEKLSQRLRAAAARGAQVRQVHIAQTVLDGMRHDIALGDVDVELVEHILRGNQAAVLLEAVEVLTLLVIEVSERLGISADDSCLAVRKNSFELRNDAVADQFLDFGRAQRNIRQAFPFNPIHRSAPPRASMLATPPSR